MDSMKSKQIAIHNLLLSEHKQFAMSAVANCKLQQRDKETPCAYDRNHPDTVEPVLLYDVRLETFDIFREIYVVRREILALTVKFASSLLCSFTGYALSWDAKS